MHWSQHAVVSQAGYNKLLIAELYHNQDTFEFSQGHLTNDQLITVPV